MQVFRTPQTLKRTVALYRKRGLKIGFVPTMGALHQGHLALIRQARQENDRVVTSIFVNPIQFGPKEDLDCYPRPIQWDKRLLRSEAVDALFVPGPTVMYPKDFQTRVWVSGASAPLCGKTRPTHFAGVATVVLKLLELVRPDSLYLEQKDYQQTVVVARMVRDLGIPVRVRVVPTVRESDGLALSSRNVFLNPQERAEAPQIYRSLLEVRAAARLGEKSVKSLRRGLQKRLSHLRLGRVDYAEILDAQSLAPVVNLAPKGRVVAACAVFYSKARLIDNLIIRA